MDEIANAADILLVEDAPETVHLLRAILEAEGYRLRVARDGGTALQEVAARPPDLILLDVMIPDLDGIAVCRRLKGDEATAFIPIVILTALRQQEKRVEGIEAGADDFLNKPFRRVELLARVRSLLRMKGLHDQVAAYNQLLEEKVAERTRDLRAALERLQELDRMKSEFVANVSHALRTPLTPIRGYLEAMGASHLGPLTPAQADGLPAAVASLDRLTQLVEDLLAFNSLHWREAALERRPTDLGRLLVEAAMQAGAAAAAKDQDLALDVPADLPPVLADGAAVARAMRHLLENACKFTPPGGRIRLRARPHERGGQAVVEVAVEDTGRGVQRAERERIFEWFHQGDSSSTRAHDGTGIGLALVQRIAAAHGAAVRIESAPGEGATFAFDLPAAPPSPGTPGLVTATAAGPR